MIIDQFVHTIEQYGLKKPWYWDEFVRGLDTWHHGLHMGLWFWRPTIWWRPMAAVSRDERAWLVEKYPELGAGLRRQAGRDHRQRQLQQHGGDPAADAALAVQHLSPAGL